MIAIPCPGPAFPLGCRLVMANATRQRREIYRG